MISSDVKGLSAAFYKMLILLPAMIVMSVFVGVIGLCRWFAPVATVFFCLMGMYGFAAGLFDLTTPPRMNLSPIE